MKKISVSEALKTFGKEWLLPQLGTAATVFTLTRIGLVEGKNTIRTVDAYAPYLDLINDAGSLKNMLLLLFGGAFLIFALIAKLKTFDKAPAPWLHKFMSARSWYHTIVGIALGSLLVPLAVWFAALSTFEQPITAYVAFGSVASTYVIVAFALYWLKLEETTDSFGSVAWIIQSKAGQKEDEALKIINDHFKDITWLGQCEVTSNSKDGTSRLEVPVLYALRTWDEKYIKKFASLFKDSRNVLKKGHFVVMHRGTSSSVFKAFESIKKKGGGK